jgi:HK97 gp10 family phage protein
MSIVVKVQSNKIPYLKTGARRRLSDIVRGAALQTETIIKSDMQQPKHGREYARGNKTHVASAPGESPAIDTGHLLNSIQTANLGDLTAIVYTNADYALPLEYGTRRMSKRPFMAPAVKKVKPLFLRQAARVLDRI